MPTEVFRVAPGKPQTLAAPIYGGQRSSLEPGGSKRNRALPSWNPSVVFGDSSPFRRAYSDASMPPLKGEVPAARAVGFTFAEFVNSNLWFPNS